MEVQNRDQESLAYISKDLAAVDWDLPLLVKGGRRVLDGLVFSEYFLSFNDVEARLQRVDTKAGHVVAL